MTGGTDGPEQTDETVDATRAPHPVSGTDGTLASGDAPTGASHPHPRPDVDRGALIGRYVVLSKLGAGAMGVVLAAYDPELDRKVALKLLKTRPGSDPSKARARLQREAQALAQLNHHNVVGVHDVGVHDGQVFVAMEFVDGETLGDWMRSADGGASRPWREVVARFAAAGRGLAAAHARGLIHRDFKPDNVMLGNDRRVRVMDFGLARLDSAEREDTAETDGLGTPEGPDQALTRTGALMGTPAYMAPEQFEGSELTARTDQFGFCIALFEALHGTRPFPGDTLAQLAFAVSEGERVERPRDDTPTWLRAVVDRGLAVSPTDRFESMDALVDALAAGESRRQRTRLIAGAGVLGLVVAAGFGGRAWDEARRTAQCVTEGDAIESTWNDAARAAVRRGLVAVELPYAAAAADRVLPYFDRQAEAIRSAHTEACLDTRVREAWDEDLLDRATWCLDDRRMQIEALVAEFADADDKAVQKAVLIASKLRGVEPCRDPIALRGSPAPPENRDAVVKVRAAISRAAARSQAGDVPQAVELGRAALADAEAAGWAPLVAAARLRLGSLLDKSGEPDESERALEQAYFQAAESGDDATAAEAAMILTYVVGYKRARFQDGLRWSRHTEVAMQSVDPNQDSLRRAELLINIASIRYGMGEYDEARRLNHRALEIRERELGNDHPDVASTLNNIAAVALGVSDYDEAIAVFRRAVAIWEDALGPDHPSLAMSLNNLGIGLQLSGAFDEALVASDRARTIWRAALGPDHPKVAAATASMADTYRAKGEHARAVESYLEALRITQAVHGPDHPRVTATLNNLALSYEAMGDYEAARDLYLRAYEGKRKTYGGEHVEVAAAAKNVALIHRRMGRLDLSIPVFDESLAMYERLLGPEDEAVGGVLDELAATHVAAGDHASARPVFQRSLALFEKALGPDHADLAYSITGLAQVAVAQGRPGDAVPLAERAVALRAAVEHPELMAASRFVLARALWDAPADAGRDRDRAIGLAKLAAKGFAAALHSDEATQRVERWLEERPR